MTSRSRAHLYCFLAILSWSTIELASKFLGPGVSPYPLTVWRFLIGGLVILPFALRGLKTSQRQPKPADLLQMCLLGLLNVCVSMLFLQMSVYYGKASVSAVLVSSNPLFVSIFASSSCARNSLSPKFSAWRWHSWASPCSSSVKAISAVPNI